MHIFQLTTRIIYGENPLAALGELAGRRVLIVTDAFLAGSPLMAQVTEHLGGSTVEVFSQVTPNPTLELVAQGQVAMEAFAPHVLLAFGGGSPMDCAKGMLHCSGQKLPLWCIPTTAGSGSEVTSFTVLTDAQRGIKYPLVSQGLLPQVAILEGGLLAGVPPGITADTGMDVLAHAAEALVAKDATPITDALAEKAFSMAWEVLPAAYGGDLGARGTMMLASTLAGMAFNQAGLGAAHAAAHALGGQLAVPHGRLNALLLPHVILLNGAVVSVAKKYAALAARCGLSPSTRSLATALGRLSKRLGMGERVEGAVDITLATQAAQADGCMKTNPLLLSANQVTGLLRQVAG